MTKPEWGSKHICAECGTRYYDMGRSPVVCPKCDAPEKIVPAKTRRSAASRSAKRAETPKPVVEKVAAEEQKVVAASDDVEKATEADANVSTANVSTDENDNDGDNKDEDNSDGDNNDGAVIEDISEIGGDEEDLAEAVEGAAKEKNADS